MKIALGNSARSGEISQKDIDIDRFLKRFKEPKRLNVTTAQYQAMPKSEQSKAKDGSYFTPCLFTGTTRSARSASTIAVVALDIDSSSDATRVAPVLGMLLDGWQWLAHSTTSSTPEKPRLRVLVFPEQGIEAVAYPALVATVAERLGVEANPESRVASQPMYLPRVPSDAKYFFEADLTGAPLGAKDVCLSIDLEGEPDALDYLVAPDDRVSDDQVLAVLQTLDPDCDRLEWIKVCCALKHQYQGDPDKGFRLFDDWSAGSVDKYDAEAVSRQWDYEDANPTDRHPVTIRSLMAMAPQVLTGAAEAEMSDADALRKRRRECLQDAGADVKSILLRLKGCDSVEMIVQDFVAEVGRLDTSTVVRTMILDEIHHRVIEITGRAPNKTEIRQIAAMARHADQGSATEERHQWAANWVYAKHTDEYITPNGERLRQRAVDSAYSRHLMADKEYFTGQGRPSISPSLFLMNVVGSQVVSQSTYRPDQEPLSVFHENNTPMYNCYHQKSQPELENRPETGEALLNHLKWILPQQYFIVLDFLAYVVQHPGSRVRWSPLIKGPQGCGKTLLAEAMKLVLGHNNVVSLGASIFSSTFTDWAEGHQLAAIEEVRVSGHNRFAIMDHLKPFITNDYISINRKFCDTYMVRNVASYIMFTNHEDALAVDDSDRRYCILRCEPTVKDTKAKSVSGYFDGLFGELFGHPGALRKYLLDHQISEQFQPDGHAPWTPHRATMGHLAKSDVHIAIDEMIESHASPMVAADMLSSTTVASLFRTEHGERIANRALSHVLIQMGYTRLTDKPLINRERHTIWVHEDVEIDDPRGEINRRLSFF